MNKYALAVMLMTSCTAGGAMAQGGAKTPSFRGCDQWGLKDKELSDCRAQWAAAKSDAERDRVKAMYVSPAFINSTTPNATTGRGSSTPPDNLSGPAGSVQPAPTPPPAAAGSSSGAKPGGAAPASAP